MDFISSHIKIIFIIFCSAVAAIVLLLFLGNLAEPHVTDPATKALLGKIVMSTLIALILVIFCTIFPIFAYFMFFKFLPLEKTSWFFLKKESILTMYAYIWWAAISAASAFMLWKHFFNSK